MLGLRQGVSSCAGTSKQMKSRSAERTSSRIASSAPLCLSARLPPFSVFRPPASSASTGTRYVDFFKLQLAVAGHRPCRCTATACKPQ